jgi:histidyl-tRNA synthetase
VRGIGEATDIVEKEMYAFEDKGGEQLALRPEGTASAIRAYVQHSIGARSPVTKLYYLGPMFRRERPAKGRYRQFYQAGAELIGVEEPTADAEIIDMAVRFLEAVGITNVCVQLNSLGDAESRPRYREALVDHFSGQQGDLCGDCQRRLASNPLRVLDCKVEGCRAVAAGAPSVLDHLSPASAEHFTELQHQLERNGTPFQIEARMVRGLDYYSRTIFEVQGDTEALGAQTALVGGGRYNDLIEELGGRSTPAIGFSFGLERLLMVLGDDAQTHVQPLVFVAGIGDGGLERATGLARELRIRGHRVETPYAAASMRSQLKKANRLGAAMVLIAGEDEAARGAVTLRRMDTGDQEEVALSELYARIGELV